MKLTTTIITVAVGLALAVTYSPQVQAAPAPHSPQNSGVIANIPELPDDISDLGGVRPAFANKHAINSADYARNVHGRVRAALPASYDIRVSKPLTATPVRDQGQFGDCWAFASAASAESSIAQNTGITSHVSPAHTVYAVYDTNTFTSCTNQNGCSGLGKYERMFNSGGNLWQVAGAWSNWRGAEPENALPYPSADGYSPSDLPWQSEFHMQNMYVLPSPWTANISPSNGQISYSYNAAAISAVKQAVYTYGALYTAYYSAADSSSDMANFFNTSHSAYYDYRSGDQNRADHAVTIIGYQDNFPASYFHTRPPGNGAFIVKNSWGTGWGDHGYFYMSYYDASLQESAFYDLDGGTTGPGGDNLVYNWSHDELGWQSSWALNNATGRMANVFTIPTDLSTQSLGAVQFVTATPNVNYSVQIYTNPTGSAPDSGQLEAIGAGGSTTISGSVDLAGYHMVKLTSPIVLHPGETFAVVVTATNADGSLFEMPLEAASSSYGEQITIAAGESYYGIPGSSWTDLGAQIKSSTSISNMYGNLNIKAFTSTPDLQSLTLSGMQTTYKTKEPFNYYKGSVYLTYANGGGKMLTFNTPGVTFGGFTSNTNGKKTVTVYFAQLATTYTVQVGTPQINLNVNGGQRLAKVAYPFHHNQVIKLPTPKRSGYKFLGWYTAKAGGKKVSTNYRPSQAITLYAHWQGKKIKVTFNANGGKGLRPTWKYAYEGSNYGTLAKVSRTGYTFTGWYTKKTGGTKVAANTIVKTSKSLKLYAHWQRAI